MTQTVFQRATVAILVLLVILWYWYVHYQTPAIASVNGIYANECCDDLSLQNGEIAGGKMRIPFRLENMKFGLTAYPKSRLEIHGTEVVILPDTNDTGLIFSKDGSAFTVCGDARCDQEYIFKRR